MRKIPQNEPKSVQVLENVLSDMISKLNVLSLPKRLKITWTVSCKHYIHEEEV